jgi:hypothetical protein
MNWKHSLLRAMAWHQSPQELAIAASEISSEIVNRLPRAERVALLRDMAEAIIGPALRDLGHEERAQLMNALLPLVVREFPLAELDLLTACPAPALPERATEA